MLVQQFSRWRYCLRRSFRSNLSGGNSSCAHSGRWFLFIISSVISWKLAKVECGIDAWATGINIEVPFYSTNYKPLYLHHFKTLKVFGIATSKHDLLGKLQQSLFNFGRYVVFVFLFQFSKWFFLKGSCWSSMFFNFNQECANVVSIRFQGSFVRIWKWWGNRRRWRGIRLE